MKNALIILFFIFLSNVIGATTYYISPTGSDSNNGSSSSPWKTLAYACSKATTSGDIISVNAGTYNETSRCNLAVGVSIVGQGVTSIIKSSYVATSSNDAAIYLNSGSGASTNGNQSISYIKLDGNSLTSTRAIAINFRNNVEIHHCTIIDFYGSAVYFYGSTNGFPTSTSTYHSTGNRLHDCSITNCCTMNITPTGECIMNGQEGFLCYNNIFDQTQRSADNNGEILNSIYTKGAKIYNNTFYRVQDPNIWCFYGELFFTEGGMEIYGNTFNGLACLDMVDVRLGSYSFGLKIYNNTFTSPSQGPPNAHGTQAIDFEEWGAVQYVSIYNNHFKNTNTAVQFDAVAGTSNKTLIGGNVRMDHLNVSYNVIENVGNTTNNYSAAICLKPTGTAGNIIWDNIAIDNNTITSGTSNKMYSGILTQTGGTMTNLYFRNNIIQGAVTNPIQISYNQPGTVATVYSQKNLYYQNATNTLGVSGVSVSGLTETAISSANPLFVSSSDFHLQTSSPAIGNGLAISGLLVDYEGKMLNSPPSIGAFESGTVAQTPVQVVPVYLASTVSNTTPTILEMTFDSQLGTIVPPASSFNVLVNSVVRTVSTVAISGTKVQLTLASAIKFGDVVTVNYTKPATNPLQSTTGGLAAAISAKTVTNNLANTAKDATPLIVTMTVSPHVHTILDVLLAYSTTPTSINSPNIIQITDLTGKLLIEKLIATGATNILIPLNLTRGIYNIVTSGGTAQIVSKKFKVF